MNRGHINISKIESYLYGIMYKRVSDNTYAGTLPDTISSSWADMCLIDCGTSIRDFDAYGRGTVLIWLYARPLADGTKNTAQMSRLEDRLNGVIANASSHEFRISRVGTYSDYDADRKWHCNIVELNLIIY